MRAARPTFDGRRTGRLEIADPGDIASCIVAYAVIREYPAFADVEGGGPCPHSEGTDLALRWHHLRELYEELCGCRGAPSSHRRVTLLGCKIPDILAD